MKKRLVVQNKSESLASILNSYLANISPLPPDLAPSFPRGGVSAPRLAHEHAVLGTPIHVKLDCCEHEHRDAPPPPIPELREELPLAAPLGQVMVHFRYEAARRVA